MRKHFEELPLIVSGTRVGMFDGLAEWDDRGFIEAITLTSRDDAPDVELQPDAPLWAILVEALELHYAEDIASWNYCRKHRAMEDYFDRKARDQRQAVE